METNRVSRMRKGFSRQFTGQIRIFLSVIIIVMTALNFTGYIAVKYIEDHLWESTREEIESLSNEAISIMGYANIAEFFMKGSPVKYPEGFRKKFNILDIRLIGTKGLEPEEIGMTEELYSELANGRKGYSFVIDKKNPEYSRIICFSPIKNNRGILIGSVRTEHSGQSIASAKKFSRMALSYQLAGTIVLLFSLIIFGYWLIKPINSMLKRAKEVSGEDGAVSEREYLVKTFEDSINELKRNRDELRVLHEKEKKRADNIELLSQGIAHEFRNSIGTISGFAELIKKGQGNQNDNLSELLKETALLSRIIDDFLRFAKPEKIEKSCVDLETLFEELMAVMKEPGAEISGEFLAVEGDSLILKQAFSNLLRNAVEAMENSDVKKIKIGGSIDKDFQIVRIADTGSGIAEKDMERIFIPFFSTKSSGTGLGLALVKKIFLNHNGDIIVEKTGNDGSVFKIRIPLSKKEN